MKKTFFLILLAIFGVYKAQSYTEIRYIPTISKDTITTKALLYPSALSRGKFNPMVLDKSFKIGERRQAVTIKEKEVAYLEFIDKDMNKRVFRQVPKLGVEGNLFEEMAKGKISWYRHHFNYKMDAWDNTIAYDDYFIKENQIVKIPVRGKYKPKLRELLADKPELRVEIDNLINDLDILEIIQKYNK